MLGASLDKVKNRIAAISEIYAERDFWPFPLFLGSGKKKLDLKSLIKVPH